MENRRSPWTGVAADEAARSDPPSASQHRRAALRSPGAVCDYKLKAGSNARAIIIGYESRGAELAGCDVGRTAEVAAIHFHRRPGVFHLSCHELTFCPCVGVVGPRAWEYSSSAGLIPPNSGHLVPSSQSLILRGFANEFHRNDEAGDPSIGGSDESFCVYQREKNFSILQCAGKDCAERADKACGREQDSPGGMGWQTSPAVGGMAESRRVCGEFAGGFSGASGVGRIVRHENTYSGAPKAASHDDGAREGNLRPAATQNKSAGLKSGPTL